ncbi:MAG: DNA translocase FtsK 4TM domain-containing protein [Candidatus Saccharicenans sp.]|jgi:S-DNA-T family DNA segregation ATPase FtsK/SpoIIIE|nr:DNA translocase FtsK 4TM domain-containing protein [Candidatus Saccharicenans sp.]MDH7493292.1 DNA translocase FtsK 4TM domain-containing protein [Candidatus Saccharicenans sp.]
MARAKKEKKTENKERRKNKILGEVVSLVLLFLAVFAALSLFTYDPADPSWANTPPPGHNVHNFAGKLGAHLAESLLQIFGLVALFLPLALGYLGLRSLFPGQSRLLWRRSLAGLLYLLVLSPLLILVLERFPWMGKDFPAGGLLGELVNSFFVRYLNHTGTFIILLCLLALLLIFTTHWSLARTVSFFNRFFRNTTSQVIIKISERQEEKIKRRLEEKAAREKLDQDKTPVLVESRLREAPAQEIEAGREKKPPKPAEKPGAGVKRKEREAPEEKMLLPDLRKSGDYRFPPFNLLDPGKPTEKIDRNELFEKKRRIEEKLLEFKVSGEVREYHPGPVITTYEFFPDAGIKVSQVASLSEELSLALEAEAVRIQRIPGKSSLGIEIPNNKREIIKLRDIIQSEKFQNSASKLTFALGKTVHGDVCITDLAIMPHLLIAGATGTGKSVALNALIASILYKATPEEVKLILIDPKRLEFTLYDGIPHLLAPVVNDPKKAGFILMDAVKRMEERLRQLGQMKVRNIEQYNQQVKALLEQKKGKLTEEEKQKLKPLPYIVIIIDELAELMMTSPQDVEYCIGRLAQLARAVGIHLVMATQRPSIDVITGTIKNNFNSRIAFKVPSKIDSRVIIDTVGAEKLLGLGDMLFMPPNYPRLIRLHCAYVSIPEVQRLVKFVRDQGQPEYDDRIMQILRRTGDLTLEEDLGEKDELFDRAVELVLATGQASASYLQRKLKLGYARASRIIDQMEMEGIIGPSEGAKPREILVDPKTYFKEKQKVRGKEEKT